MDSATKQYIEKLLSDYPKLDYYIKQRQLEIMYPPLPKEENTDAPKGTDVSNPVEKTIITRQMDLRLNQLEKTKEAIEKVLDQLDSTSHKLVKLKYWTKPQTRTWVGIAKEVGYSRSQCFRVRDSIISAIGEELGLYSEK